MLDELKRQDRIEKTCWAIFGIVWLIACVAVYVRYA